MLGMLILSEISLSKITTVVCPEDKMEGMDTFNNVGEDAPSENYGNWGWII